MFDKQQELLELKQESDEFYETNPNEIIKIFN